MHRTPLFDTPVRTCTNMTKSPFFNERSPQEDDVDLETASFDGDDFADLGMEFGNEDIVNTFLEDPEAQTVMGAPHPLPHDKEDSQTTAQDRPISTPNTNSTTPKAPASASKDGKKKDGAIKGPSRRRKRPKGKPRRPLCGYNIFFQRHSKEIQATTPFKDLGRIMGERWKALSEDQRAIYEKEAEKDVIRFRREMDAYERKRRERLCPSPPKNIKSFYPGSGTVTTAAASLKPPPGWSATNASSLLGGAAPHLHSPHQGPPALPSTGLHVPGQFVGSPPPTMALPQGTEITLPDATGVSRKYRVVYACYRMTQKEANDYMARFAALTAGWHPGAAAPVPPAASPVPRPAPSPQTFPQAVHPPPSPQMSQPSFVHPSPHPAPPVHHSPHHSPHPQHHVIHHPPPHSPHAPRLPFAPTGSHTLPWPH